MLDPSLGYGMVAGLVFAVCQNRADTVGPQAESVVSVGYRGATPMAA
ncbi:hypothetical protein [Trueperella sp. LYQ141]